MREPQLVEKPALTVVGLEASFISALSPDATNFKVIRPLWDKFVHRAGEVRNRTGHDMLGVIYGRPAEERSHPHELQYIAAVPVSGDAPVPEGMVSWTIPAGTFAVFTHRGPIQTIGDTVHDIHRNWLPQSAWQHAQVAEVELYDDRFCGGGDNSEMEIWVSVRPKASGQ